MGWSRLLIFLLISITFVGCRISNEDRQEIVLWTSFEGAELQTLQQRITEFEAESSHRVSLLKVPFPSYRNKVLVAGPAQQGPDILIAPHDWIGILETANLIAPIPENIVIRGEDSDFFPVAIDAVTYDEKIYLAPIMMECVVLVRNVELCPERPTTLDQMVEFAKRCQEENERTLGFAYRLEDFYFSWAFLAGFGADFLEPFEQKDLVLEELNFSTPEAVSGASWVADLNQKHHLVPPGMTNEIAVSSFMEKRLGMMLSGPWNLGAIREAGIEYSLEPIPSGPAGESSPFVGVTGAMLSRYAVDKPGVQEFLTFLASSETGAQLCRASGRAPVRSETVTRLAEIVTDKSVAQDLALFSEAARNGTPLPNHPAMAAVWPTMQTALELITTGQTDPAEELTRTTERVRSKIRFMME